ncbi:MAG: hypothetical protein LC794_17470 [Acidobacteria bacterium]|nr:hypothetical protein [Acidobacteriota bacterium]
MGRVGESAAFIWTMTGGNDNAILEIGRNPMGSLDGVENHCHASKEEMVKSVVCNQD